MHDSFAKEEVYTGARTETCAEVYAGACVEARAETCVEAHTETCAEVYAGARAEARPVDSKLAEALLQNLSKEEREYRQAILEAIERKVSLEGFHRAVSHPERARQFMPFAALKGYEEMVSQQETINNERVDC